MAERDMAATARAFARARELETFAMAAGEVDEQFPERDRLAPDRRHWGFEDQLDARFDSRRREDGRGATEVPVDALRRRVVGAEFERPRIAHPARDRLREALLQAVRDVDERQRAGCRVEMLR